jgi:hypothetical protein
MIQSVTWHCLYILSSSFNLIKRDLSECNKTVQFIDGNIESTTISLEEKGLKECEVIDRSCTTHVIRLFVETIKHFSTNQITSLVRCQFYDLAVNKFSHLAEASKTKENAIKLAQRLS